MADFATKEMIIEALKASANIVPSTAVLVHTVKVWKAIRDRLGWHSFTDKQIEDAEKSGKSMGYMRGCECYVDAKFPELVIKKET